MTQLRTWWFGGVVALLLLGCTDSTAPLVPARLFFTTRPTTATAGVAIRPFFIVKIVDASGDVVPTATNVITISLGANSWGGTLAGTLSVAAVRGVATFSDLSIDHVGAGYTLIAEASGLPRATSAPFVVTAGTATTLAFTVEPSDAVSGATIAPAVTVTAYDAFGNVAQGFSDVVWVAFARNLTDTTFLYGNTAVPAVSGVATFSDLAILDPGSGYALLASSVSLRPATSTAFNILPGIVPTRLFFMTSFGNTTVGRPTTPSTFRVGILDRFYRTDTTATNDVTLSLAPPGGATLGGTVTVAAVKGIATFTNVTVDRAGNYSLVATSGQLTDSGPPFVVFNDGADFVTITAGAAHTCALTYTGAAYCWGANDHGQLGDGTTTASTSPVAVTGGLTFSALSAGGSHTCGMSAAGGDLYCWGDNTHGQLGDGTTIDRASPVLIPGTQSWQVSAGGDHTCAVTYYGYAECWGSNAFGQLGDGTTIDRVSPVRVGIADFGVYDVSAGGNHTCGLWTDGELVYLFCWGANDHGQLADGTRTNRASPVTAPISGSTVLAGGAHTCSGGYCWGANGNGQLGDGTTTDRTEPVYFAAGISFVALTAGTNHTCGVVGPWDWAPSVTGPAYCWGANDHGQLGDGTTQRRNRITPVAGGLTFVTVSAGGNHTCGVTVSGAYCWGNNASGQLGNGSTNDSSMPVKVAGQP